MSLAINPPRKTDKLPTSLRKKELIAAALSLAAQRSPGSITTTDLAQHVGLTQGAVFRHFPSKEALWFAVMEWVSHALMQRLRSAASGGCAADGGNPTGTEPQKPDQRPERDDSGARDMHASALHNVFMSHVDFIVAHPGVPRLIFQELQHSDETPLKAQVRRLLQQYRHLLAELIEQARADQSVAHDVDTESASLLFIGSIQGLVMQSMLSGQVSALPETASRVYETLQHGLLGHSGARRSPAESATDKPPRT